GIAARGNVAQPQALLSLIDQYAEYVLAVRRDGRRSRLARVRDLRDCEILEWQRSGAVKHGVHAESCGQQKNNGDESASGNSQLMSLRDVDGGTAPRSGGVRGGSGHCCRDIGEHVA